MPHVVLLGDSIFDNAAYVRGGPDVVASSAAMLPPGWRATLLAVDGAVIDGVGRAARPAARPTPRTSCSAPAATTRSATPACSTARALERRGARLARRRRDGFEARYRRLAAALAARGLPVTVCTIYEGNLGPPADRLAAVALAVFNDAILRVAAAHALPVIELRHVCTGARRLRQPHRAVGAGRRQDCACHRQGARGGAGRRAWRAGAARRAAPAEPPGRTA
jgi:hypothetical protein